MHHNGGGRAEVLGQHSKPSATGEKAQKAHAKAVEEQRRTPWQPYNHFVTQVGRLTDLEREGLVTDYAEGMGCVLLARKYGVSTSTVLSQLKAAGVELRPSGKLTPEDQAEIRRLRAQGWTHQKIADRFGVTRAAVSIRLNRPGNDL